MASEAAAGNGGSGKVVLKEQAANIIVAPGMWNLSEVFDNVKAGTWTNDNQ